MYILFVEEDHFYASMVMGYLKKVGFTNIKHIDNGVDCLLQVYEEATPDLLILDARLSRVNGVDVMQKLLAHKPGLKILVLREQTNQKRSDLQINGPVIDIIIKDDQVFERMMPHIHIIHSESIQKKKSRPVNNLLMSLKRFIFAP
jgi:DNA-binding NtrC family response regulator